MKKETFTVAISTRYGGENLVKTASSIKVSKGIGPFRFIVIADNIPIKNAYLKKLQDMGVEVYEYKKPRSLAAKMKQIVDMTKSEILIFTQDDIIFDPNAMSEILKTFLDSKITAVSCRVVPFPARTLLEKIIEVGTNGVYKTAMIWRKSNNYLTASGRCMAFRMDTLREMRIIDGVLNLDAYLYFENKRVGGKFKFVKNSIVYNSSPRLVNEHLNQSSRFQYSKDELATYFDNLDEEYNTPTIICVRAFLSEFLRNPIYSTLYALLYIYTRLSKKNLKKVLNPLWNIDLTTKR